MPELDPTNKITRTDAAKKPPARPVTPPLTQAEAPSPSDRVTLSHKPGPSSPVTGEAKPPGQIRDQLVSKFRDILEQGTYQIKADEIAKKMVQKIQDEKDKTII